MMFSVRRSRPSAWLATVLAASLGVMVVTAQTVVTPPKNKFTPEQDVQLGKEAAAEVRQQYPVISDDQISAYLDRAGRSLVAASPKNLNHPVFEYSFTPVNLKEINAFALPGGPMFVHRGMFDAAAVEARSWASWRTNSRTCCCGTARRMPPRRRSSRSAPWPARLPGPSSAAGGARPSRRARSSGSAPG
jgi:hypothetical protein